MCICEVGHIMYTDSSSGRQLVMRQGTGKVKHQWQDFVDPRFFPPRCFQPDSHTYNLECERHWYQVTIGVLRVRLLVHELNVANSSDYSLTEYHAQSQKHGGCQMSKLAKRIAQVMIIMGPLSQLE